jgi:hypothetical protein
MNDRADERIFISFLFSVVAHPPVVFFCRFLSFVFDVIPAKGSMMPKRHAEKYLLACLRGVDVFGAYLVGVVIQVDMIFSLFFALLCFHTSKLPPQTPQMYRRANERNIHWVFSAGWGLPSSRSQWQHREFIRTRIA